LERKERATKNNSKRQWSSLWKEDMHPLRMNEGAQSSEKKAQGANSRKKIVSEKEKERRRENSIGGGKPKHGEERSRKKPHGRGG